MNLPRRLRTAAVFSVAVALILTLIGTASVGPTGHVYAQADGDVLDLPSIALGDPTSGAIRTYDAEGTLVDVFDSDYSAGDEIAFGYFGGGRLENRGCLVHARADDDVLDFCATDELIIRLLNVPFSADDDLAMGNILGPEAGSDEVLIARADTGDVDVYGFAPDATPLPVEVVTTFDSNFSAGDEIVVAEDPFGGQEVLIIDDQAGSVEIYQSVPDSDDLVPATSFQTPFSFDHLAVADFDGQSGLELVTISRSNGVASIYEYSDFRSSAGPDTPTPIATLQTSSSPGDTLAVADIQGNLTEDILLTNPDTGQLDGYAYTFDPDAPFAESRSLNIGAVDDAGLAVLQLTFPDADADGLFDHWEINGFDATGNGEVDVDLPTYRADPLHKDLFIEYDWMPGEEPSQGSIELVADAFSLAPATAGGTMNPDGQLGITVHFDTGNLGGGNELVDALGNPWTQSICDLNVDEDENGTDDFYDAKLVRANFDPIRTLVFRYGISAESCGQDESPGGRAETPGNDFVEYGNARPASFENRFLDEASTLMHEIGHNLGLEHGGFEEHNCKANYVSIMSYSLDAIERIDGSKIIDFSPPRFDDVGTRSNTVPDPIDESALDESEVLDTGDPVNKFAFRNGEAGGRILKLWPLNQQVNWNGNTDSEGNDIFDGGTVEVNVDDIPTSNSGAVEDEDCPNDDFSILESHNDWDAVVLPFQTLSGLLSSAPVNPVDGPEPTMEDILERQQQLHTTDLAVTAIADPEPAIAGTSLTYTLSIVNGGPNPAHDVQVVNTLPEGATYLEDDAGCSASDGVVTCQLGKLPHNESRDISITVEIEPDLVFEAGGETAITNVAEVSNEEDYAVDSAPDNNSAAVDTVVEAQADLAVTSFSLPDDPIMVLIGEPTTVKAEKQVENLGPSGPANASLQIAAITNSELGIALDSPTEVTAPEVGESVTVTEMLSVSCAGPGLFTVPVTNTIEPTNPATVDPVDANNHATDDLTVRCALPVALNIKPGSAENPISFRGRGVTPVAVLSTEAGEYGLPEAFDATTIDPSSVRFGPADVLSDLTSSAGASEVHSRGHIEDALELDEQTTDGDQDMVFHFRLANSGLEAGDSEACVVGEAATAAGETVIFFGCDTISTRT